jgi:hypothetical protein
MANEVLIQQLDSLRAMYDQQQKRATALQSALKALPAAQTNAQRILQDYQTQNAAVDVAQVQGLLTDLRLKEEAIDPLMPELRRENKQLAAIITALKDSPRCAAIQLMLFVWAKRSLPCRQSHFNL